MEEKKTKQEEASSIKLKQSKDEFLDKLGKDSISIALGKLASNNFLKCLVDLAVINCNRVLEKKPDSADVYLTRARAYCILQEFDKAWDDVHKAKAMGIEVSTEFIEELKRVSGRQE